MCPIKVIIADDSELIRESISLLIDADPRFQVIGEACNGAEAVEVAQKLKPDVIVMDYKMPILGGPEAISRIRQENPAIEIVVLSFYADYNNLTKSIECGAKGFVLKDSLKNMLLTAIEKVYQGELYYDERLVCSAQKNRVWTDKEFEDIPPREQEFLALVAQGKERQVIAECMNIKPKTVDRHRENLMDRLKISNKLELYWLALAYKEWQDKRST